LPLAEFPDEVTAYKTKIQFRKERNGWPLVQLGPGVATVNFTSPYTWDDFEEAVRFVLPRLIEAYEGVAPQSEENSAGLNVIGAELRYINAVALNWLEEDVLQFLDQGLHTTVSLPDKIGQSEVISGFPTELRMQLGYPLETPPGHGIVRLATGHKGQEPAVVWEIVVHSENEDAPQLTALETFWDWLLSAHSVIEDWFFALIEGDLEQRFRGG
jgi:uncharacterized protein (TIGR04255 family)